MDAARATLSFEAIGTQWEIVTDRPVACALQARLFERIERFEATYSRFRPDSLVSRVAAAAGGGCFAFPADAIDLFDLYDRLHRTTTGAVDPLVGRDLELLGYDPTYSLEPAPLAVRHAAHAAGRASWLEDVARDGSTLVTRRAHVIDVGAAGKGYLVDIVSDMLAAAGIRSFLVDAGGDLRHVGPDAIRIGLEHPFDPRLAIGAVDLRGRSLCASAINRRAWGNGLHHVLDARTGLPVRDVVATWVIADDAATADGLATALFFVNGSALSAAFRFSYVRMFANGTAEASDNFDGELF
ncbi:FAD:protein FMN transferase [compost metagenome]